MFSEGFLKFIGVLITISLVCLFGYFGIAIGVKVTWWLVGILPNLPNVGGAPDGGGAIIWYLGLGAVIIGGSAICSLVVALYLGLSITRILLGKDEPR